MGRDFLELADDSLFIDKIKITLKAADAGLLNCATAFALKQSRNGDSTGNKDADLLLEQDADAVTTASAPLAPLLRQGLKDGDDIRENFRPGVAATIEDLSPPFIPSTDTYHHNRKNIHALWSSSKGGAPLFVPTADQLSPGVLRRRMEHARFYTLDPGRYLALKRQVLPIQANDDRCLRILLAGVQRLLDKKSIESRLQGRRKILHGIRRKVTLTRKTLEEIMDRIGLRAILNPVPGRYTVPGRLHAHFKAIPDTLDDDTGLPRNNGHQSLHACVYPVREISYKPVEIQIRTNLTHREAPRESLMLRAEIPGTKAEDLKIETTAKSVSISGGRQIPKEDENASCRGRQREGDRFSRAVPLSGEIDPARTEAKPEKSLLTLRLPETEASQSRQIPVTGGWC